MPRLARPDYEDAVHHVMGRGIEKRPIFTCDRDRSEFLDRMEAVCPECGLEIYAWSLMPNHFHLLLRRKRQKLGHGMRRLLCGYASWFNRRYERSGRLFQGRYKSKLVETERYLARLVRYIHLNPVKAGMTDLETLESYPWTGHRALMGTVKLSCQNTSEVLAFFGDSESSGRKSLSEYMSVEDPEPEELGRWCWTLSFGERKRKCHVAAIGSEEFRRSIAMRSEPGARSTRVGNPGHLASAMDDLCREMGASPARIRGGAKGGRLSEVRAVISFLGTVVLGLTTTQVSRHIGVSQQSVSKSVARGRRILTGNRDMRSRLISMLTNK
jgi:REP element-mobilizing transposase RayT